MREEIILRNMRSGDSSGLEALMDAYIPYVSTIVWNILRGAMPSEDAEEVVSDVFISAWDQAADLKPGHVKGWLGAVARNKAKNRLRQIGQTLSLDDDALDVPSLDDPASELERAEEQVLVRQALDNLQPQDKEIFLRYYYYAQTVAEISTDMSLNVSTVKTKLRRGRNKLKKLLTKELLPKELLAKEFLTTEALSGRIFLTCWTLIWTKA